jgi:RNA polymerase sigma-70 factor, ECF subfamily
LNGTSVKILNPAIVNHVERMNSADPAWLVTECIAGNEAAMEALIHTYEADVFRLALSIVGDQADAQEITQETFIAALRSLRNYEERKSFKAWLYVIALNLSRSHLRKQKFLDKLKATTTSLFRIESQKQSSPEEAIILNEKETAIWAQLNKLDERHRIVVILRYFHELSVSEISEILNVNEGTIHSRLHTARERLRDALTSLHGD